MGNSNIESQYKSGKWQLLQTNGTRQILQHKQTKLQIQKYFSISDFKSLQDRYKISQIYRWRKQLHQNFNIVKLYHYQNIQYTIGYQQDQYVYTQRIFRLNHTGKIYSKPQAFLLILHLLKGLYQLFNKFGLFNINLFLLGISPHGIGKVWVNQNFAKNYVQHQNQILLPNQNDLLVVVNNLITIIKQRVYNNDFMPQIQYPFNMTCIQGINYIQNIRRNNILFQVKKIYLDRNQFKIHYDQLYNLYIQKQNIKKDKIIQNNHNHNPNQNHINQFQNSNSTNFFKKQKQYSQTLSSDSNSRAKENNENVILLNQVKPIVQQQQNHKRISLTNQTNKIQTNDNNVPRNNFRNVIKYDVQNNSNKKIKEFSINIPAYPPQNRLYEQVYTQNLPSRPSINQKFILPSAHIKQNHFKAQQISPKNTYNHMNIIMQPPSSISPKNQIEKRFFVKRIQNQIPNIYNQSATLVNHPRIINEPKILNKGPNFYQKFANIQYKFNSPIIKKQIIQIKEMSRIQQPQIQNIELCQSVIVDKKQLHQKMKDFDI